MYDVRLKTSLKGDIPMTGISLLITAPLTSCQRNALNLIKTNISIVVLQLFIVSVYNVMYQLL